MTAWITHLEAARILGVNPGTIQEMLARGDLERSPEPRSRSTPSVGADSVERLRLGREQRTAQEAEADERRRLHGTPPDDEKDWLTTAQAAELLGLSGPWVKQRAKAERILATMHGGRWWVVGAARSRRATSSRASDGGRCR